MIVYRSIGRVRRYIWIAPAVLVSKNRGDSPVSVSRLQSPVMDLNPHVASSAPESTTSSCCSEKPAQEIAGASCSAQTAKPAVDVCGAASAAAMDESACCAPQAHPPKPTTRAVHPPSPRLRQIRAARHRLSRRPTAWLLKVRNGCAARTSRFRGSPNPDRSVGHFSQPRQCIPQS